MSKRTLALALAGTLVASVFSLASAGAQEAAPEITEVPESVQITDPQGDANFVAEPAENVSNVGDILNVWFTNDAETVSVHINTFRPPPASSSNILYSVFANPVEGSTGTSSCLRISIVPVGAQPRAYQGETIAKVQDRCSEEGLFWNGDVGAVGEVAISTLADDTGVLSATFPRSYGEVFGDGKALTSPLAYTYVGAGSEMAFPHNGNTIGFSGLSVDWTDLGTDYTITSGGPAPEPDPEPGPGPVEPKDPPKNKNCAKIKNKKKKKACKKKNKKQPKKGCDAYVPGELGAEAETIVLTDAATAEEPVVHEVELGEYFFEGIHPALGTPPSQVINVQVDSAAATAGLYATFSFPARRDYDLWAYWPSGAEAASSHGFNLLAEVSAPAPLPDPSNTRNNHAGETTASSESLVGVITPDCGGYTLEMTNYFGEGGTLELSLWLGEGTNEPKPES